VHRFGMADKAGGVVNWPQAASILSNAQTPAEYSLTSAFPVSQQF